MRGSCLLCSAVLAATLAPAPPVRAQFQQPSAEELKMTADPKAPGASAVYLDREETDSQFTGLQTIYARIKVLADKGKELATVTIPFAPEYSRVDNVQGRTIHADGTIFPLSVKPEDLLDYRNKYYQQNNLVFTLPNVEVGSIIEYRVQIVHKFGILPYWEIQTPYFIHKEHNYFNAKGGGFGVNGRGTFAGFLAMFVTPQNAPLSVKSDAGEYTVDLADVPPQPDEDWMPPMNTLRWRVEFYQTFTDSAQKFWDSALKSWSKDTEQFLKVKQTLRDAANAMVSPGDSEEQKAHKIYAAVLKLENTDYTHVKSDAERKKDKLKTVNDIEDVWKNRSGAGDSIALLYVGLARAAGLKAWAMQVVNRDRAIFDATYLSTRQLDDYIAIVEIGGKEIYLDPGEKVCPFGVLHWTHALATGFRQSAAGPKVAMTPADTYRTDSVERTADLVLDAAGNVTGTARIVMSGAEAIYWRQQALENDPNALDKDFIDDLNATLPEGVSATFDHLVGLDNSDSKLMAIVKLSGGLGTPTRKRLIVPGLFFESRASHPFVAEAKRSTPIDMHIPEMQLDDVVYHLPQGYTVGSAPHTADVTWPGSALLRINSTFSAEQVQVARLFARNFTLLGPGDYNNLHDFYLKLAAADQQQILLARTAPTKGH